MAKTKVNLLHLAEQAMEDRGLEPEFSPEALNQADHLTHPALPPSPCKDLKGLLWCSIDNDDSRDLDQLTYAEKDSNGNILLWIAVADVDALVQKNSPIDLHAQLNTTSVYTPAKIFPMLPEKLSTDLTSLNPNTDRVAVVVTICLGKDGECTEARLFQAVVHNKAKLTYNIIGEWLKGAIEVPENVKNVPGLELALKCQHEAAQILKNNRNKLGALTLESPKAEAKVLADGTIAINYSPPNFAQQIIEEFMIAANIAMAQEFRKAKIASLRRVVRIPKRWDRIVEIAKSYGEDLPEEPSPIALDHFLGLRKKADPDAFPDLSLVIIKLLGRGEYVIENRDSAPIGHFGLAVTDYTHSTAPNRRYPDLISQRQFKALIKKEKSPYTLEELTFLASHCTQQEDAATKVERQINKSAAALMLSDQIGRTFKGIITGIGEKGTWVRIFEPTVEGKVTRGFERLDVGDRVSVRLTYVDVERGFIDFVPVHP